MRTLNMRTQNMRTQNQRTQNMRTQNMRTLNQRTLKSTYTKKSLCVDTKNFLAFTQKLGQTHKRTQNSTLKRRFGEALSKTIGITFYPII